MSKSPIATVRLAVTSTPAKLTGVGVNAVAALTSIKVAARLPGVKRNSIPIRLVDPGSASQSLSVAQTKHGWDVNLATDGSAVITSTEVQVVAALHANAVFRDDWYAAAITGGSTVAVAGTASTTGGTNSVFPWNFEGLSSAILMADTASVLWGVSPIPAEAASAYATLAVGVPISLHATDMNVLETLLTSAFKTSSSAGLTAFLFE